MRSAFGALYRVGLRSVQVVRDGARDCTFPVTGQLHHQPHHRLNGNLDWPHDGCEHFRENRSRLPLPGVDFPFIACPARILDAKPTEQSQSTIV